MEYCPYYRRISLASLCREEIVVPFRFADETAFKYRDINANDAQGSTNAYVNTSSWCNIMVVVEGATLNSLCLDIDYILHVEALVIATGPGSAGDVRPAEPWSPAILAATKNAAATLDPVVVSDSGSSGMSTWDKIVRGFNDGLHNAAGFIRGVGDLGGALVNLPFQVAGGAGRGNANSMNNSIKMITY